MNFDDILKASVNAKLIAAETEKIRVKNEAKAEARRKKALNTKPAMTSDQFVAKIDAISDSLEFLDIDKWSTKKKVWWVVGLTIFFFIIQILMR